MAELPTRPIELTLNPVNLMASMDLWREAIESEIDPRPEVRPHMLQHRRSLLENMERVARDWDMVFSAMSAHGEAARELAKLRVRVAGQREWAIRNLRQLNTLQDTQRG